MRVFVIGGFLISSLFKVRVSRLFIFSSFKTTPPLESLNHTIFTPHSTHTPLLHFFFLHSTLHAALRAASIRCDEPGQATLINLLLHNYLSENLVEQADVLVSKAPFPESATNNDAARYLFYLGE